jgi:hypothetical protein
MNLKIMSISSVLDIILETGLVTAVPMKSLLFNFVYNVLFYIFIVGLQGMLKSYSFILILNVKAELMMCPLCQGNWKTLLTKCSSLLNY